LRLLRIPAFVAGNASAFLMSGSIFGAAFMVSQYFQFGLGYGPLATGVRLLPFTMTPILIAPLAGAVSDRLGRRPLIVTGLAIQALGFAWVALRASTHLGLAELLLALLVAGVGASIALPTVPTAVLGTVAPADMGTASGINSTMQRFGAVFAVALATSVSAAYGHVGSPAGITDGFRPAIAVSALLALLGALAALALERHAKEPRLAPATVDLAL
jgi:MFS family permease